MATYKKPNIVVNGNTFMDAIFEGDARAYEQLKAHKTAETRDPSSNKIVLVPFHAVKAYGKRVVTGDINKDDPYGCINEYDPWITVAGRFGNIKFKSDGRKVESHASTNKTYAEFLELLNNRSKYAVTVSTGCYTLELEEYSDDYGSGFRAPIGSPSNAEISLVSEDSSVNVYADIVDCESAIVRFYVREK